MVAMAFMLLAACSRPHIPSVTPFVSAQTNSSQESILLGHRPIAVLQAPAYKSWYEQSYQSYIGDTASIAQLRPLLRKKRIDVFLGSWCGDSRREVPRLLHILHDAGMDTASVHLIFVDNNRERYKQSPQHEERGLNIHHVPTIIVYAPDKELGRIVEAPEISLEKDLLAILKKENYLPRYKAVNEWLRNEKLYEAENGTAISEKTVAVLKPLCRHSGEFNTLGYVLLAAKEYQRAIRVFKLNTLFYPADPNVYDSLADAYIASGQKEQAIKTYEKLLQLKPGDAATSQKIAAIKNQG